MGMCASFEGPGQINKQQDVCSNMDSSLLLCAYHVIVYREAV